MCERLEIKKYILGQIHKCADFIVKKPHVSNSLEIVPKIDSIGLSKETCVAEGSFVHLVDL